MNVNALMVGGFGEIEAEHSSWTKFLARAEFAATQTRSSRRKGEPSSLLQRYYEVIWVGKHLHGGTGSGRQS